jgi:hypothetical protein
VLSIRDELLSLEARKAKLQSRLEAPEMPELLHPRMSDVYRDKVGSLCLALENEESRTGAADAIRALVEAIVLEPDGERLKITLKGDLAGMLSAARDTKRSSDTGDLMVQIKLVAGARNRFYRPPCTSWRHDLAGRACGRSLIYLPRRGGRGRIGIFLKSLYSFLSPEEVRKLRSHEA